VIASTSSDDIATSKEPDHVSSRHQNFVKRVPDRSAYVLFYAQTLYSKSDPISGNPGTQSTI